MIAYHDQEWGRPQHDDRILFEFLILEGAQAGLSWETILKKRQNYREAFGNFDPQIVAHYDSASEKRLLTNTGIVRNRLKIKAAITNARAFLTVQEEFGSFNAYIWMFVNGQPILKTRSSRELPTRTIPRGSGGLRGGRRGFKFVGTTICYAFMQATGLVNDHEKSCFLSRRKL